MIGWPAGRVLGVNLSRNKGGPQRTVFSKGERSAALRVGLLGSVRVAVPVFILATAVTMKRPRRRAVVRSCIALTYQFPMKSNDLALEVHSSQRPNGSSGSMYSTFDIHNRS